MDTSLADIAAVTRDNDGWGCGNSGLWLFAILALMGGGFGGWGNRTGDFGQYATAASQTEILLGQQFQGVNSAINSQAQALDNKIDRLGNGVADATFALNNSITGEGRALQMQLAECCCGNKEATAQVRYDLANFAAATREAIHADGEATRAMLQQNKIESLQGQISQLQLQAALCGVVRYPQATTYTSGSNPFCGCGNGCGGNI